VNGHAKAVLWIGFALIAMGIVARWSEISAVLFGGSIASGGGGDVRGNPPPTVNPKGGKCPPGYSRQPGPNGGFVCVLHSRLPV
jgi:hypothetical protein